MREWYSLVQIIAEEIDACIMKSDDESVTLASLSKRLGYSEFYISRKFLEISGMHFRDYLRYRKAGCSIFIMIPNGSGSISGRLKGCKIWNKK